MEEGQEPSDPPFPHPGSAPHVYLYCYHVASYYMLYKLTDCVHAQQIRQQSANSPYKKLIYGLQFKPNLSECVQCDIDGCKFYSHITYVIFSLGAHRSEAGVRNQQIKDQVYMRSTVWIK